MERQAIVLAAGKGTRMKSKLPKVLHPLAGRPLLEHVLDTAGELGSDKPIVIVGHQADVVQAPFKDRSIEWVLQTEQLGTGHAVQQTLPYINEQVQVLILYGDVPLIQAETLRAFASAVDQAPMGVLTFFAENPTGYGRIIKDEAGGISAIVEEKDADTTQRLVQEVNSGIYLVQGAVLKRLLPELTNNNAQQEYILTDLAEMVRGEGGLVKPYMVPEPEEVSGINDRKQLAALERYFQRRAADQLMLAGVSLADPNRIDVRGKVVHGQDVSLDINVVLEGDITLGDDVVIGANCVLRNVEVASGTVIAPFTHIEGAQIGANCNIGPFARIRPGSEFSDQVKIGNFVETKKTTVGLGSKINHLSYVGDAALGESVNVGAGTITCNYDGVNKFKTQIEDGVFVGSNTALVAPVTLEKGATIAAGSTISASAPADKLTIARSRQYTSESWQRPTKKDA